MNQSMNMKAVQRATRSVMCLPFKRKFYNEIDNTAISAEELVGRKDWQTLVFVPFGAKRADEHFEWMIKIGIVRREVDGQGLTNRIKLTPLGKEVLDQWAEEIPRTGIRGRIIENLSRHRPRL